MIWIIYLFFLFLVFIRFVRWTAVWQQKEYRMDRLISYLKTHEGKLELSNWINLPFIVLKSRKIKRPVKTKRALLILTLAIVVGIMLFIKFRLLGILFAYIFSPFVIIILDLPNSLIVRLLGFWFKFRARRLLDRYPHSKIIGITGSYGKTSTRHILAQLLKTKYSTWTAPASHNTPISLARDLLRSYNGEEWLIIEFAAYKQGEISQLTDWLKPAIGVLTGLTPQHLSLFGDFESLIQAKSELFNALPKGSSLYVNTKDKKASRIVKKYQDRLKVIRVTIFKEALSKNGNLLIKYAGKYMQTNLVGAHYAPNVSLAIKIAKDLGVTNQQIIKVFKTWKPKSNFVTSHILKNRARLFDDGWSSNPKGFKAGIDLIKGLNYKNNILIASGIIDLGTESRKIHEQLAKSAIKVFDQIVYFGNVEIDVWQHVAENKLIPPAKLIPLLNKANANTAILIEGRLPSSVLKIIQRYKPINPTSSSISNSEE